MNIGRVGSLPDLHPEPDIEGNDMAKKAKVEITRPGVHVVNKDGKPTELKTGHKMEVELREDGLLPKFLMNKCRVLGDNKDADEEITAQKSPDKQTAQTGDKK